jgi:hypothetical protein
LNKRRVGGRGKEEGRERRQKAVMREEARYRRRRER